MSIAESTGGCLRDEDERQGDILKLKKEIERELGFSG